MTNNRFCCESRTMSQEGIENGKGSSRNKVPDERIWNFYVEEPKLKVDIWGWKPKTV